MILNHNKKGFFPELDFSEIKLKKMGVIKGMYLLDTKQKKTRMGLRMQFIKNL